MVDSLAQQKVPDEKTGTKDRNRAIAGATRDLLFLGHLCGKAQILALDAYHEMRGFTAHLEPEA